MMTRALAEGVDDVMQSMSGELYGLCSCITCLTLYSMRVLLLQLISCRSCLSFGLNGLCTGSLQWVRCSFMYIQSLTCCDAPLDVPGHGCRLLPPSKLPT